MKRKRSENKKSNASPQTGSRTGGGKAIKKGSEVKGHGLCNFPQMGQRKRKGRPVYIHRSAYIGRWGRGGGQKLNMIKGNSKPLTIYHLSRSYVAPLCTIFFLWLFCKCETISKHDIKKKDVYETVEICTVTRYELMITSVVNLGGMGMWWRWRTRVLTSYLRTRGLRTPSPPDLELTCTTRAGGGRGARRKTGYGAGGCWPWRWTQGISVPSLLL